MINIFQNIINQLPKKNKDEFLLEIYRENLQRMIVAAVILIITETVIVCLFSGQIANADAAILVYIMFSTIMLPILYRTLKNINTASEIRIKYVQRIFLYGTLAFGCVLALIPQFEFASMHIYIIAVFAIAASVCLQPLESLVMYFSVYMGFFLALPYYQTNKSVILILSVNAFMMNIIAWIFSRMVYRMRINSFMDKKIIMEKNHQLEDLAIRDSMTMLLNHKHIYKRLDEEIERAKRIKYPLSIIMLDIDDFKCVNDCFGHRAGDSIIIKVAQILVDTCRLTDIVGRYGGEEFIVIMPGTPLKDAAFLAERIREAIESAEFDKGIAITISGGIKVLQEDSAEELIRSADKRLYKAKSNGKNRFEMAG